VRITLFGKNRMNFRILAFCFLTGAAVGAPQFQKFEPPLKLRDGVIAAGQEAPPWIRACCSEWTPWVVQFEEWQSYRSARLLKSRGVDEARFRDVTSRPRQEERWWSILATAWLEQDQEKFLLVISYPGELNRFPRYRNEMKYAFAKLLLKHDENGWKLVDLGTDISYESAVAKEMLSIDFSALGIAKDPQQNQPPPTAPSGRGSP
jgi:hypothetical protein